MEKFDDFDTQIQSDELAEEMMWAWLEEFFEDEE